MNALIEAPGPVAVAVAFGTVPANYFVVAIGMQKPLPKCLAAEFPRFAAQ